MALTRSFPTGEPTGLSILDTRRIFAGLVTRNTAGNPRTGIFPVHTGAIVSGTASMAYSVGQFVAATSRLAGGVEFVANDATMTVATTASPAANTRIDIIWVRSRFTQNSDGTNAPELGVTQGTAATFPIAPSVPAGALEIARAEVSSTATSTAGSGVVITQTAPFTVMEGGVIPFRSVAEMRAWSAVDGTQAVCGGFQWYASGGSWRLVSGQKLANVAAAVTVTTAGALIVRAQTSALLPLPVGQKLTSVGSSIGVYLNSGGGVNHEMRGLSGATPVASNTGAQLAIARTTVGANSSVGSTTVLTKEVTTAVDNVPYSAAMFLISAGNTYGPDGQEISIFSA